MKKNNMFRVLALVAVIFAVSCGKDDPIIDEEQNYDVIVGKWRAPVVAPLLVDYVDSIHVEFRNNQTYTVTQYKDNAPLTLTGTYAVSAGSGTIRNITLEQAAPSALTAEGIYRVQGNELTYEVAQTEPSLAGVTAPTASGGFGSTSGGILGEANIQKYVKMN